MLRDRALGLILCALWLVSWWLQYLTHDGSIGDFINATMENWQSEFLQTGVFVVLATYMIYRGSPQSRDGADAMQADLTEIKGRLARIEATVSRIADLYQ